MFIKSWKKVFLLVVLFFSFFYGNAFADVWSKYGLKKCLTKEKFEQGVGTSITLDDCACVVKNSSNPKLEDDNEYLKTIESVLLFGICGHTYFVDENTPPAIPGGVKVAEFKINTWGGGSNTAYAWVEKEKNVKRFCEGINGTWKDNKCSVSWNNGYVKKKKGGGGSDDPGNPNPDPDNPDPDPDNPNPDPGPDNPNPPSETPPITPSPAPQEPPNVAPPAAGGGVAPSNTTSAGRNVGLESARGNGENKIFLEKVPGMEELASNTGEGTDPTKMIITYLNWLIRLSVVIGSILAVVYIVIGGVEYMTTTIYSKKSAGKEKIVNAIMGIIFLISGYLIFEEINPNILNLNFGYKPSKASEQEVKNETSTSIVTASIEEEENGEDVTFPGGDDGTGKSPDNNGGGQGGGGGSTPGPAQGVATCTGEYYPEFKNTPAGDLNKNINCKTLNALHKMNIYIKNKFGKGISLHDHCSGYDDKSHGCRSTRKSSHYTGKALDINLPGGYVQSGWWYYCLAKKAGFDSFGFGRGVMHVDTRGSSAWWCYDNNAHALSASTGKDKKCKEYGRKFYNGSNGYGQDCSQWAKENK